MDPKIAKRVVNEISTSLTCSLNDLHEGWSGYFNNFGDRVVSVSVNAENMLELHIVCADKSKRILTLKPVSWSSPKTHSKSCCSGCECGNGCAKGCKIGPVCKQ